MLDLICDSAKETINLLMKILEQNGIPGVRDRQQTAGANRLRDDSKKFIHAGGFAIARRECDLAAFINRLSKRCAVQ